MGQAFVSPALHKASLHNPRKRQRIRAVAPSRLVTFLAIASLGSKETEGYEMYETEDRMIAETALTGSWN